MITHLAIGTAPIPDLPPGGAADVVISLDRPMPSTDYDVSLLRSVWLPGITVTVKQKATQEVTVAVAAVDGQAGSAMVHAICARRVGPDTAPPETPPGKGNG